MQIKYHFFFDLVKIGSTPTHLITRDHRYKYIFDKSRVYRKLQKFMKS